MDFVKEIKKAMLHLQEACRLNDAWKNCWECPFKEYCDVIEEAGLYLPDSEYFMPIENR